MTYSLVARDGKQWGVAVQSKFLAVGSVVPWAEPVWARSRRRRTRTRATARTDSRCCAKRLSAAEVVERLVAADDGRAERQLGVVDADGRAASWTGLECMDWAGHRTGDGYAAQGNILVGPETVDALAETFEAARAVRWRSG